MNIRKIIFHVLLKEQTLLHQQLDDVRTRYDLSSKDRRFFTRMIRGIISREIYLDYVIAFYSKYALEKLDRELLILLRMGIFQLIEMDKIPERAAVYETVKLAKKSHKSMINAVMRQFIRDGKTVPLPDDPVMRLSIETSHPQWLVTMWFQRFGEDFTKKLLLANNQIAPVTLRINSFVCSVEEWLEQARDMGVVCEPLDDMPYAVNVLDLKEWTVQALPGYENGAFIVQDLASQKVVQQLGEQSIDLAIDVCASPGGKSIHLTNIAKKVYAFDKSPEKLLPIMENMKRMGVSDQIKLQVVDAEHPLLELFGKADVVVVDGPCSNLGVIRKKPDVRNRKSPEDLVLLSQLQESILSNSSNYVKMGGKLLYSTCTISKKENESVVANFIGAHPDFVVIKEQQLFPHIDDCDGFYICWMERKHESFI